MDVVDIMIHESGSGGDLSLINDDLATISGLTNQVYLALFGGNIEQSTVPDLSELDDRQDWWGNSLLLVENQLNSNFERKINQIALTSGGVRTLENAAKEDLKFLKDIADVTVNGSISGLSRFELTVNLVEPDKTSTKIKFIWDGTKKELIQTVII